MNTLIAWFARNPVAANLLMVVILISGVYAVNSRLPIEFFPEYQFDVVNVSVPYRGATPTEVEEAINVRIEEAVYDLQGIDRLTSEANEGYGRVSIEVARGTDVRELLDDIKVRVDSISTFPVDAEKPLISIPTRTRDVISVVIAGDLPEARMRELGERVRDDLVALPALSQVTMEGARGYEVAIEISETALQRYGLTLAGVGRAIAAGSTEVSAGVIKADGGEILLRTEQKARRQSDFEDIVVLTRTDGTRVTVGDIGVVRDGFEDVSLRTRFNGRPAVILDVGRTGDESALEVAAAVRDYLLIAQEGMPDGVDLSYWRDRSTVIKGRLSTLLRSAVQGGVLILVLLTLFLRFSVALWVFIGVPVCFMGGLAVMPEIGATINLVTLFAFIISLGIVVDDAIVTGENIYTHLRRGESGIEAAIAGTQEVAVPVTFGVLTTVTAFVPILFVEGFRGAIFAQIATVVIAVLLFSLVESKLILPAHLMHVKPGAASGNALARLQQRMADGLESGVKRYYRPLLAVAIRYRYATLSGFIAIAMVTFAVVSSGHLKFIFFPRVPSEILTATLTMPSGTPFDVTTGHIDRIAGAARELRNKYSDQATGESLILNILDKSGTEGGDSNIGRVRFQILPPDERSQPITSAELAREWRELIGQIPGAKELSFRAELGRGGSPLDVQLSGSDVAQLVRIAGVVKERLAQYPGVFDITDTYADSKAEMELKLRPQASSLGVTANDLARQVREAFFGYEVQRIQRNRDDVRVMVRYPETGRRSMANLETMRIRTPDGAQLPFAEVAYVVPGLSPTTITRVDRQRTLNVLADYDKTSTNVEAIKKDLEVWLDDLLAGEPGVRQSFEGEAREQRESFGSLATGLLFVLFVVYALLAIPFRSYLQPLIVMSVIPFGAVGAILGHLLLGKNLSIASVLGMLALTGVVINDSLVLVDYINRKRRSGAPIDTAVRESGVARFRPVLLTSLTTFAGLTPLLLEKSTQAQFLIPMAVSLGFGILFATFITLFVIPINYLILDDLQQLFRRLTGRAALAPAS